MLKNLCVFCGATDGKLLSYKKLAYDVGSLIALQGMALTYGGGSLGLMGEVSKGVLDNKGFVLAIYPKFLIEKENIINHNSKLQTNIETANIEERKALFDKHSDAYLVLPGGFGTLEEFFHILVLKYLKRHNKPIIVFNYKNYWEKLLITCNNIISSEFATPDLAGDYQVVNNITQLNSLLLDIKQTK